MLRSREPNKERIGPTTLGITKVIVSPLDQNRSPIAATHSTLSVANHQATFAISARGLDVYHVVCINLFYYIHIG